MVGKREREIGLRWVESRFRENVAQYQGDINPQDETSAQIAQFLKERNITTLLHFTDRKNLFKILTYGLLSRKILDELQWNYSFNDTVRADWRTDCISLSISKINEYLLKRFIANKTIAEYVIIEIDATMLYRENNKRIYCQTNAATAHSNKGGNLENLKAMFDNEVSYCTSSEPRTFNRQAQNKKDNETTDSQAEILWADWVNPNYINGYYLNNQFYHNKNQHKTEQNMQESKKIETRKIIIISKNKQ